MSIRDEFEKAKSEAKAIVEKAKSEARGLTDDEKAETEKRFSRMSDIKATLDVEKRFDLDLPAESTVATVAADAVKAVATASTFNREPEMKNEKNEKDPIVEGIKEFARTGDLKTFHMTTGTAGGALVPTVVAAPYIARQPVNAIRRGLSAIGFSPTVSSSTANASQPFFDDSANLASLITSDSTGTAYSESECNPCRNLDPAVVNKAVNLQEYRSEPLFYSERLVKANTFDITDSTLSLLASRIDRKEETVWMAAIRAAATVGVTTASPTAITPDEWQGMDESTSVAYDGLPSFYVLSKGARQSLRGLKDGSGRYVLDFTGGVYSLFGKPIVLSASLDPVSAGGVVAMLVIGETMFVRDVEGDAVKRYEGESAHPNQIGFESFRDSGFNFGTAGIRLLKMHA